MLKLLRFVSFGLQVLNIKIGTPAGGESILDKISSLGQVALGLLVRINHFVLITHQFELVSLTTHPTAEAQIGNGASPCVALRADMDALPVTEEADVPFRSKVIIFA